MVTSTSTRTAELLRLSASVISDEEGSVELDESLFELVLGMLVDVFLVVGHYRFGNGLSDGVDLRCVTTAGDADADIDCGEFVKADDEEGFVDL